MAGPVKEFEVHPYVQFMQDKYSPYKKWIESEGVPIVGGEFVQDVRTEPLGYWKRKDCKGGICTFSDQMVADAYIAEIDPGKSTRPQRQLYEEIVTVATGRGATSIWYEGTAKRTFEWERGSTFAIPLNAWHQVVNATSSPALLLAATTAPNIINLIRDAEFVMNCGYNFLARFDASDDYFRPVEDIGLFDHDVFITQSAAAARDVDPTLARLLVLSAANWTYTWYDPAGPLSPDEIADRFTDLLLDGLATKETQR